MGARKRFVGEVVSDAMDKTVVVKVTRIAQHPLYKKKIKQSTELKAHDEREVCSVGDKVVIEETRPLSKTKRFRVVEVLESARIREGGDFVDSTENNA